jgi:hypothetical protein
MQARGTMDTNVGSPVLLQAATGDAGLRACRRRLAEEAGVIAVPDLAAHATGGKLLRAEISLLVSRLGPACDEARALRLAAAIELLHTGALAHDDVVDGSLVRRSRPTIEATHGTRTAIVAGAWLILRGLAAIAPEPAPVRRAAARAVRDAARDRPTRTSISSIPSCRPRRICVARRRRRARSTSWPRDSARRRPDSGHGRWTPPRRTPHRSGWRSSSRTISAISTAVRRSVEIPERTCARESTRCRCCSP